MSGKRYSPEEIIRKLREQEAGHKTADVCRLIAVIATALVAFVLYLVGIFERKVEMLD